jgi:hypothetical protein
MTGGHANTSEPRQPERPIAANNFAAMAELTIIGADTADEHHEHQAQRHSA